MAMLGRWGHRNYFNIKNAKLFDIVFNDLLGLGFFLVCEATDDSSSRLNSFGEGGCFMCGVGSNNCDCYLSPRDVF